MSPPAAAPVKDLTANPAPVGLLGFGMTTVLLNLHNAGVFELNSVILAMGLCYGGAAQVIAGLMEWRKGNTFACTAFISYGFFWLSLVALLLLPKIPGVAAPDGRAMAAYLTLWGVFTAAMFLGTFRLSRALQWVFGTLTALFFMLAWADATGAGAGFRQIAGVEGIVCGLLAIYTGLAQMLNELHGRTLCPLGEPRR